MVEKGYLKAIKPKNPSLTANWNNFVVFLVVKIHYYLYNNIKKKNNLKTDQNQPRPQ